MKKYLLPVMMLLFLLAAPWIVKSTRSALPSGRREPGWTGILTVLHAESFSPASGSMENLLARAGEILNKRHPGVVVRIEKTDADGFLPKIAEADVISFPPGLVPESQPLAPAAPARENAVPFAETGYREGVRYAVPWCAGVYGLMWNGELAQKLGMTPSAELETLLNYAAQTDLPFFAAGRDDRRDPAGLLTRALPAEAAGVLMGETDTCRNVFRSFRLGKLVSMAASPAEIALALRQSASGDLFPVVLTPLPGGASRYTDMVQYAALTGSGEEARQDLAREYVDILLEEDIQGRLAQMGLLSSTGAPRTESRMEILWGEAEGTLVPKDAFSE